MRTLFVISLVLIFSQSLFGANAPTLNSGDTA